MSSTHKHKTPGRGRLARLALFSSRHPVWVLTVALALAVLSIHYTLGHLDFKTSRNDLVAEKDPVVERFSEISDDFGRLTNAIVVVEGDDVDRMKAFITDLAEVLDHEPEHFEHILYRIDTSSLEGKKLLYLSEEEIADLRRKLSDYGELIEDLAFNPGLEQIFLFINQKISEATVSHLVSSLLGGDETEDTRQGEGADGPKPESKDPVDLSFLRSLLTEMHLALSPGYRFHSPWDTFFKASAKFSEDGFLISDDQRFAFMTLNAVSEKGSFTKKRASLNRLREHIRTLLETRYSDLEAGVTGGSALADDEMAQAMKDSTLAFILAFVGCALLFMVAFRQIYNPLLVVTSLVLSISWTFGLLTFVIGHLTVLSVAFASILFGLGIDFGIHLVARYTEERGLGLGHAHALDRSYQRTGKAILIGAVTTATAFYAVMFADFRGIQELGFIAGSGVLLALLSTFTVLPALLSLVRRRMERLGEDRMELRTHVPFLEALYRHPVWVLVCFIVVSAVGLVGFPRMRFDYNLLNLQAKGTESVVWERRITEHADRSSWFAVTSAASMEEVREKARAFKALPSVKKVDSMADLVPKNQDVRMEMIGQLKPLVEDFEFGLEEPESLEPDAVLDLLEKIKFKLRTDVEWDPQKKPDEAEIVQTRQVLLTLIDAWKRSDPEKIRAGLGPFQTKLFRDFSNKFDLLKNNVDPPGPVRMEDVPEALRDRFQGRSGRFLIQIFSKENIWEKRHMTTFVRELKSVDPGVTGPPIVGFVAIELMRKGYIEAGFYSVIANIMVIGIGFRKWKPTCLAFIPLGFTVLWTMGWLGWMGVYLNLANLLGVPLIIGVAVDDGVHVVHRFHESPNFSDALISGSTARAISLTSWTTMVGFGSLMIAKHYGVFSMGLLVTLAIGIAWVLSVVLLPLILLNFVKTPEMHEEDDGVISEKAR